MKSKRLQTHRTKPPRAKHPRADKLRAWKARIQAARAHQTQAPRPAPTPPPAPKNERAHTVFLLSRIGPFARALADKALDALEQKLHLVPDPARPKNYNPFTAFLRLMRAAMRASALRARLEQDTPLPERIPPKPPALQAAEPSHPAQPTTPAKPKPPLTPAAINALMATEHRHAANAIERLLKTRSLPQIVAMLCRDIRIDPASITWPNTTPALIQPKPPLPRRPPRGEAASPMPPTRPDPHPPPPRPN